MNSLRLCLVTLLALFALQPVAGAGAEPVHGADNAAHQRNTIKRYLFSTENAEGIRAELGKMNVTLIGKWMPPAKERGTRITGRGGSGFMTRFLIEHAGGRFHVYSERPRPQHPVASLPYVTQEVVFNTPDPAVTPVGTLSHPAAGGPFPGVVLVAGSGPHDRDGGMSLHKTLAVLADHLTRQGFAVLRYDKRGVGLTGGARHPQATTDEYAADALAAVRFLAIQPNVRAAQIGIVGHSEGGIVAPMVAAQAPEEVRFIVMLGGPGLPGIDVKSLQDAAMRRADGMEESLVLMNRAQERELLEIAASERTHQEALAAMRAVSLALPAATKSALAIPAQGIPDEVFEGLLTPWFRRFLALDPRYYLDRVRCPALALIGERDLQVPPAENLQAIEQALAGRSPKTVVRQVPGMNHALQTARTGSPGEYFLIDETVAPSALALMSRWMNDVVRELR